MMNIATWLKNLLIEKIDMGEDPAGTLSTILLITSIIVIGIGLNWILQRIFAWLSRHNLRLIHSKWHVFLVKRNVGHHILLLVPGIVMYMLPYIYFERESDIIRLLHRADIIYMIIVLIRICNALMMGFLDLYKTTDKSRNHPLQGLIQALQVMLYFVGGIIITAILIDKSPTVLLTGLGASAAILMLIFKDSILGFVAGIQLAQNNMIRIGDWIQMPDGTANGTVEEITLNTVKVRNWDNTISMIPPYTLVSSPFKNWRGMQESGGRRVDKNIYVDINSVEICPADMISDITKSFPLLSEYIRDKRPGVYDHITNIQLYRAYIETYLRQHPDVNPSLDIIITQKESTAYGLPVEVYFFTKDKAWATYEKKQSDIFDHFISVAPEFGLKIYQRP